MTVTNRRRWSGILVVTAIVTAFGACSGGSSTSATPSPASPTPSTQRATTPATTNVERAAPVPAKYQIAYAQTAAGLSAYERAIAAMPTDASGGSGTQVGFVELLEVNGNRQAALLRSTTMAAVDQSLDAFKALGVGGVVLGVKLPLLIPSFTPQASAYARFWATVAAHCRARGFRVDVELGSLFCGTIYSHCCYRYPTTVAGWAALTAEQGRTVIDQIHPDYLDLISEPNTEATLTRIPALQSLAGFTTFVTDTLRARGPHHTTKVLAGAGSWFPAAYDQAIIGSGIDGLVTRIYPARAGTAANLAATSRIAHDAGKPIVADEVWLYKGTTTASGNLEATNQQGALNCYSFWQPLDARFLRATREWATKSGSPLVAGFWSWQTLAYSTWTPQLDTEPSITIQAHTDATAVAGMARHSFTGTGLALVGRP